MVAVTAARPTPVTPERLDAVLEALGFPYLRDSHSDVFVLPAEKATTYVDVCEETLRVRSVWRNACSEAALSSVISLILRWNREKPGPKAVIDLEAPMLVSAHTDVDVSCGLDEVQLQAGVLLSLIMAKRFFNELEEVVPLEYQERAGNPHLHLLSPQIYSAFAPPESDNETVREVESTRILEACQRLHLRARREESLISVESERLPVNIRLFGDNTWMLLSSAWIEELPKDSGPQLFSLANGINAHYTTGVVSLVPATEGALSARVNHVSIAGEGLTDRQLDTQILLGISAAVSLSEKLSRGILAF